MITLIEEHSLGAWDKNETWMAYEERKDKQPCRQVIKHKDRRRKDREIGGKH